MIVKNLVVSRCDALGACQSNRLCEDCDWGVPCQVQAFAPGVIQGPPQKRQTVQKWLCRSAALAGLVAIGGFCAGYFFG